MLFKYKALKSVRGGSRLCPAGIGHPLMGEEILAEEDMHRRASDHYQIDGCFLPHQKGVCH